LKRFEPNMLLAITTALALVLMLTTACLSASPTTALKYVGLAIACSVGFVVLNKALMTARKRKPRVLITPENPAVMFLAAIFPIVVLTSAVLPLLAPGHLVVWLVVAAAAWSIAFALYLVVFTPWLLTTRLDGKDGWNGWLALEVGGTGDAPRAALKSSGRMPISFKRLPVVRPPPHRARSPP